jgi:tetratricopeptide (TPR) repeat protein
MRAILAEAWVRRNQTNPAASARLRHEARVHLARVRIADGNYTDAERILREEMQRRSRPSRPLRPSISASMTLGECLKRQGRYTDSERTYRELVASIDDKSSYDSLCARSSLGQVLLETNPKEAERVHREVVETAVRVLAPESIQVLSFTGDLALAILYNQRFEEARSMLAPLVERMCRILGPVHPDTLTTKGNLALALHLLGNSAEAAGIQSAILAELTATLGADHPSSVSAKANLADYLARSTGSPRDSVQMAREVLDSNRKVLGPEHPDTLMSALNLSSLMMLSGSSPRTPSEPSAEEIIRTTVAIAEKSGLPATGAHRLGASTMLADCMHKQGKTTEAVGVMHGLVAACREQLGEHNESTVAATKRLECMTSSDRTERPCDRPKGRCIICLESDPVPIQRGCACRGDPGLSHIQCMVNQADYRDKNGPPAEMHGKAWVMCLICKTHFTGTMKQELARAWFEKTCHLPAGDLRRVRPEQHLIECAYVAGNYTEAEKLARSMLHRNRLHLGETHPMTLYTDNMLGNTLCCLERYEEAETVQRRVLATTIIVSGARSGPHALQMSSLAHTLGKQGKLPEALRLAKEAVAILRSNGATVDAASGSTATDDASPKMFLTAASTLAYLFGEQGDEAGAGALYSEVLAMRSRILGPDHPETLTTKASLAATMSRQGNYEEAKRLEMSVLLTMQRVLGPTHPHTLFAKENLEYTLRRAQAAKELAASTDSTAVDSRAPRVAKGDSQSTQVE